MRVNPLKMSFLGLLAGLLLALASPLSAQTTNSPPAAKKPADETVEHKKKNKIPGAGPFHGKLAALDKVAKTITVGKRTFQITSETKIKKSGKPATLEEGVLGEPVSGYLKPGTGGKLIATTVNFGPKSTAEGSKKHESDKEAK